MKFKTSASITVTSIPFLSPLSLPSQKHKITRALSYSPFRDSIFYIYAEKKLEKGRELFHFKISSPQFSRQTQDKVLQFLCMTTTEEGQSLPGTMS